MSEVRRDVDSVLALACLGRIWRQTYIVSPRADRPEKFVIRDHEAGGYLMDALRSLGFTGGHAIYNHPGKGPRLVEFDDSFMRAEDVIALPTRPPIHDLIVGHRRPIRRSFLTLEEKLFKVLLHWFERCSRSEIVLTNAAADVSPEIARRQSMEFVVNGGAQYKAAFSPFTGKAVSFPDGHTLTPVFLVYEKHVWPGGPGLVTAFGMGAVETLVWCYKLATKYRHLLCSRPFIMGEMSTQPVPPRLTMLRDFARAWDVEIFAPATDSAIPTPPVRVRSGAGDPAVTP